MDGDRKPETCDEEGAQAQKAQEAEEQVDADMQNGAEQNMETCDEKESSSPSPEKSQRLQEVEEQLDGDEDADCKTR